MRTLNFFAAAFPLAVVFAAPQFPFPTGTRDPCSTLGDVQCSSDRSRVQLCEGSESRQSFHWKDIKDCGEPNGCHSRGPQSRAHCILKYPLESTHLGNIPTDVAVSVVESRDEVLTRDSTRCYETGTRRCSPDKSTVQECTDMLFWKKVQDCFQPGCCHDNKMFPSRPTCHCPGTLTAMVRGKATPTLAPRAEPLILESEPSDIIVASECKYGALRCSADDRSHIERCSARHNWYNFQDCGLNCCQKVHGEIKCQCPTLRPPRQLEVNGFLAVAARTESTASDAKSNDPECINGQLACAINGRDLYICINHIWNLERHCTICKTENNGHVACMGNGLPAPLVEDVSKVVARAESPAPDTTPTSIICVEYQQKCGDNGKDEFICRDGAWTFQSRCDLCKEDNGIFTCFSKITPLPSNRPTSTASIIRATQAAAVTLTLAPIAPTSGVDEASVAMPAGSCISGHLKCNGDGHTMDKCKNRSWIFWDNCSRFGRGRCIPDGDTAYCEGPLADLIDTAPAPIPRTAASETQVSPAPASIPSPELICTDGQLRCTSDQTSIEKCKNKAWKLDRKCSNEFGNNCVFYRNTAHCGYTNEATDLVARVPALEENTENSETPVPAAPTSGVDETLAIAPPLIINCGGGALRCGPDGESVEVCAKNRFVFAYSCRSVSHNEYHSRCVTGRGNRSAHCTSIHERADVVPASIQERRDDPVFSPYPPAFPPRTVVGNEQDSSSGDIVTRTGSSDECTNGEKECSIDRQHIIVCENEHWKDLQYCGPAGCDYRRPSYEPYCLYSPTLRATSTADKVAPRDSEPAPANLQGV